MSDVEQRLATLERRVDALEHEIPGGPAGPPAAGGPLWALDGLRERLGEHDGAVLFTGTVPLPGGERYDWQWGVGSGAILAADWTELAAPLAALAHPVRLRLLREVLAGTSGAAELQERVGLATTGQLYHHLRQLVSAGWLRQAARGRYAVPGERVVPLLVVLAAARR